MEITENREIVIGDIHGCYNTFHKLIFDILRISKNDNVYLLGDYIDRGPKIKEVIDLILTLQKEDYKIYPIMGNHEVLLLDSSRSIEDFLSWYDNGCIKTLNSFGIKWTKELSKEYLDFFKNLPYYIKLDDFVLVHGGLNLTIADPFSDTKSMPWMRKEKCDIMKALGKRIIAGHTPLPLERIKQSLNEDKIFLDGGCVYYKRYKGLGNLCALVLNNMELFVQENIENQ